jgi:hypothetical protein
MNMSPPQPDPISNKTHEGITKIPSYREIIEVYCSDVAAGVNASTIPTPFCSFHSRPGNSKEFREGEVVCLGSDAKLCQVCESGLFANPASYLVICDELQKKNGHPLPSQGHWCAALGIVRARIDGAVVQGDLIGPNDGDSNTGIVISNLAASPVIGFALESKHAMESDKGNVLIFVSQNPYIMSREATESESEFRDVRQILSQQIFTILTILERFSSFLSPGIEVRCKHFANSKFSNPETEPPSPQASCRRCPASTRPHRAHPPLPPPACT